MLFIQIAVTAFIVRLLALRIAGNALSPVRVAAAIAAGEKVEVPVYSLYISIAAYWVVVVAGLAGIWSL